MEYLVECAIQHKLPGCPWTWKQDPMRADLKAFLFVLAWNTTEDAICLRKDNPQEGVFDHVKRVYFPLTTSGAQ